MKKIVRHAIVPYSPAQMFALVDNIPEYPKFLPWCASAREICRDNEEVEASIEIAKGGVRKAFTTKNKLTRDRQIDLDLVDGPFRTLKGHWKFEPLKGGEASKVTLDLEFEFSSRILTATVGPVFSGIANSLVDAFVARAKSVYG